MLSVDEARDLIRLCEAGRLYEVEAWAKSKSLQVPRGFAPTPLRVAINKKFHSLVELLLRHGVALEDKNAALKRALRIQSLDLAELALEHGADIDAAECYDVLRAANTAAQAMRFIDRGLDVTRESPFALALILVPSSTILATARQYIQAGREQSEHVREQLNVALRTYSERGDEKWIKPLLRAGADPKVEGRTGQQLGYRREVYGSTAYVLACRSGHLPVLRLLQPSRLRNAELANLLLNACMRPKLRMIQYLVHLGAPVSTPDSHWSSLSVCLSGLDFPIQDEEADGAALAEGLPLPSYAPGPRLAIRLLLGKGAKWTPTRESFFQVQRMVTRLPIEVMAEILNALIVHGACSNEIAGDLVAALGRRKHSSKYLPSLQALLAVPLIKRQARSLRARKQEDEALDVER